MSAFWYGMGTGFSLIMAIGAQNAFVLKQGLKKNFVFAVCLVCALSDSVLIYLSVMGFSHFITQYPLIVTIAKYLGAAFLLCYGLRSFYSAIKKQQVLNPSQLEKGTFFKVIAICLAFTWLNPHVYLDTVLLIGSVSLQFSEQTYSFACGAILASWIFFFSLGYGARILLPLFSNPLSWKILDIIIGIIMWTIALTLLCSS
ncbi:LysE/ArgO family amino acid transporter [Orbus sturtevantii]|uniref:LysE/ArgO family amino acid transporter n=1 Tax=Orbus sturtevantii TaxID=3074109 RepID=UPI00370D361F